MDNLELDLFNGKKINFIFQGKKYDIYDIPLIQFSYKQYTAKIADLEFNLTCVDVNSTWYGNVKSKEGFFVTVADKTSAQEALNEILLKFSSILKTKEGYYKFLFEEEKSKPNV